MSLFDFLSRKKDPIPESVVSALAKNEIIMKVDENAENILPNTSKIGGKPWLPKDFVWPEYASPDSDNALPLSFLCQIDLEQLRQYDRDKMLPEKGMLYFFYEFDAFCWGFDPADKGSARVFYFEDTSDFVPHDWPASINEDYIVPEMPLCFESKLSYPSYEELEYHSNLDCDWEHYDLALEKLGMDTDAEDHKLLGYAHIIQNEMLSECERVTRGLYCGTPEGYNDSSEDIHACIEAAAKDWTLLLQLTTLENEDYEWMWGDCGMLYFYIKKQDLAAKRFENAWFALQCG